MMSPAEIAASLTSNERAALRSLPARDRGHMPDDLWWAYYTIIEAGLSESACDFLMVPTPLGVAVLAILSEENRKD